MKLPRTSLKVFVFVLVILMGAAHTAVLPSHAGPAMLDDVLKMADRLREFGSHSEAITEYKRFIFFNPESEHASDALYGMGLAYRAMRDWQGAINALKASVSATEDPRISGQRRIILATTLIATGNYSLARLELLKVSEFSKYPSLRLRSLYFEGVAALYEFEWDVAGEAFGKFYSDYAQGEWAGRTKEIELSLLEARKSHKSASLAKLLSTIIPGMGQTYAGDWRDGLNALVLNGLIIGLTANAVYRKGYLDVALISSISVRYYRGNIYRAEMDVRKYNESADRKNAAKILSLVRGDEPL